jgi:hypothetical protein
VVPVLDTVATPPDEVAGWDVGDGRRVSIRPVRPHDADDLFDLFEQLDPRDRWWRLGTSGMPEAEFFDRLAGPDRSSGDERMVAELLSVTGSRLVGEAGVRRLPNGSGELTMVAAPRWRGFTGPVLLDAVVEAVAGTMPNLEADVRVDNTPMLALLHDRGAAVVAHDHWDRVRLRIGTTDVVPTWTGGEGSRRVLIEAPGGRSAHETELRDTGDEVLTCFGPRRRRGCPAIEGRPCPLAAAADVIVAVAPADDALWGTLLSAHATHHPSLPVVVVPGDDGERSIGLLQLVDEITGRRG